MSSPVLLLADAAASALESPVTMSHIVTLAVTGAATFLGAVVGGVKWLGRHFDRLGEERAKERAEDNKVIEAQRIEAAETRKEFLAALTKRDVAFAAALEKQEEKCAEARREELKILCRIAGLPGPDETGKFKVPPPGLGGRRREGEPS